MDEDVSGKCSLRREQSWERKKRFLEHLSVSGNISEAGRVAEVRRSTLYLWKDTDKEFSSRWEEALEEAADALEAEARRRAVEGYDEPITYAGRVVCDPDTGNPIVRKRYSDGLMAFLLRAHRPSRFRAGMESEGRSGTISINISSDDSAL
ncbi:MAG: hypothetical protein ABF932_11535 [Gluconobacter potus]|uniref:Terminase n=1 Tax=Gluconobacter potus TaxID=2724927 RepID=A0ABR9YN30_9PROT|nr:MULTISPECIES: hypothetical protein [Gluconobacter]MBF0865061.1 hypothetical protein [Gluconobacter sp. R71656]MBF0868216.1 hypothetical protein [Gluconobacter sp. R75628]MBF0874198.1 hypothetical protein [Gluconobacter sp. R75629]MBF0883175.1 hypothetical protein [Gluconobacter potus]